jgi:hypothetical protein
MLYGDSNGNISDWQTAITDLAKEHARGKAAIVELGHMRKVLAILVKRAGGEVTITCDEIMRLDPDTVFTANEGGMLGGRDLVLRVKP